MWMSSERFVLAINGDYRSSGRTCSDAHETKKTPKNLKNRRVPTADDNFTHARTGPFGLTDPNFCMCGVVADVINCAKFFWKSVRGSGAGRPWKMAFPIETVHRPYNSAALPRRLWLADLFRWTELPLIGLRRTFIGRTDSTTSSESWRLCPILEYGKRLLTKILLRLKTSLLIQYSGKSTHTSVSVSAESKS